MLKNLLLTLISLVCVLGATLAADRVFGKVTSPPGLPETYELIFPPFSEQHYETADFRYSVYINSIGIRDRELPKERGDVIRVLAIGDSYTYGWGLDSENTWVRLLENTLREAGYNVEILNLGKPGAGPPFYAELAEKAIPLLRPNLVLIGMLQGNDLRAAGSEASKPLTTGFWEFIRKCWPNFTLFARDIRREREYTHRTHKDMPKQISSAEDNRRWTMETALSFMEKMTPEQRERFEALDDEVKAAYRTGHLNPYMIDLAMQNPDFYILTMDIEDPWTQTCIARTASHLSHIKKVAEEYSCSVIVLAIPEGPYVNRHALKNMARVGYTMPPWLLSTTHMDESIRLAAEHAGLPFYEVTAVFRAQQDNPHLFFTLDGHLTAEGSHLLASTLHPILENWLNK